MRPAFCCCRSHVEGVAHSQIKSRGVNREKCDAIESQLVNAAIDLNAMHVKVGVADIDDLSAIASEFNVRKRMLPVALLFKTRARDGDKLKADLFASPIEVSVFSVSVARVASCIAVAQRS